MNIQPFEIAVRDDDLDDLQSRLEMTRFTDEISGSGSEYGVSLDWVKRLTEYWCSGYDWRKWESRLNEYPQFTTEIDGQKIHFLHVLSKRKKALPLILTHGWPGTVVEYLDVIDDLSQDFHLVIPSLPARPPGEAGRAKARTGNMHFEGFEGGQMPLQRRLPKRGFANVFRKRIAIVNLRDLARFESGSVVDRAALIKAGLLKGDWDGVKLLGHGEIQHPLHVQLALVSAAAKTKIEAAGGKVEVVS